MKSCLIVDDSRVVRKVARRIVQDLGFECEEAENGKEALEFCEKNMPDSILLDWNMPEMDGISFLEKLRSTDAGQSPVVIFCTIEHEASKIQKALQKGANEFIMKPFESEIIESKFKLTGMIEL